MAAKQKILKFHETRKFHEIIFNFVKFRENKFVDFRKIPNKFSEIFANRKN